MHPTEPEEFTMRLVESRISVQTRPASRIKILAAAMLLITAAFGSDRANAQATTGQQTISPPAQTFEPPTDAELDRLGMQKLAEMTAMSRHDEICPDAPREWSAAFVILLMKNPPSEEEVEAQEAIRSRYANGLEELNGASCIPSRCKRPTLFFKCWCNANCRRQKTKWCG
jgi:hypothetical protein